MPRTKKSRPIAPPVKSALHDLPPSAWFKRVRKKLLNWYDAPARDLPWRGSHDPYAIWVSEIMLQQTTVAAVRPRFLTFLKRFPTVKALAKADEATVLREWEGLGYYRRARQLHAAAKKIVAEHKGVFPNTAEQILELPGIGRYTAGAIASIAFDLCAPILEANTLRVWARLLGEARPLIEKPTLDRLWQAAEHVLPKGSGSGHTNQALMDLGNMVCTVKTPLCKQCPLAADCVARKTNQVASIPSPAKKTKWTERHEVAVVIRDRDEKILFVRYAPGQRWAGLWDFVRVTISEGEPIAPWKNETRQKSLFDNDENESRAMAAKVEKQVSDAIGLKISVATHVRRIKHVVTRYKITLDCVAAMIDTRGNKKSLQKFTFDKNRFSEIRWATLDELADMPFSTTGRELIEYLSK